MKVLLLSLSLVLSPGLIRGSDKPAYRIFDSRGKEVKYEKMLKDLSRADIIFFGELHNNAIAHWMELEITMDLYDQAGDSLVLAAEMFETDNQLLLDEYLGGLISASRFEEEAKLWKNYPTDYKPLVEFARDKGLPFVGSNIPRRYASMVATGGFEALDQLSPEALALIAPLPIPYDPELACYKNMMNMGHGGGMANANFPKAQAIKDATMAHSILRYWHSGRLVIHFNGSYHSENREGILWYIDQYHPGLEMKTIATVSQEGIDKLDEANLGKADYLIAVPETMTNTY